MGTSGPVRVLQNPILLDMPTGNWVSKECMLGNRRLKKYCFHWKKMRSWLSSMKLNSCCTYSLYVLLCVWFTPWKNWGVECDVCSGLFWTTGSEAFHLVHMKAHWSNTLSAASSTKKICHAAVLAYSKIHIWSVKRGRWDWRESRKRKATKREETTIG